MMFTPFRGPERAGLVQTWREALATYDEAMARSSLAAPFSPEEAAALADAQPHLERAEQAESDYFERLPRVRMGCCPFDGEPLVRSFDPFGFDGPWWRPDRRPEEPTACRHFLVLAGAVDLGGLAPHAGRAEIYPGPQVPYVIPRILEQPGTFAVISCLPMDDGRTGYAMAYFSERRIPPQELTADWPRTNHVYTDQLGQDGWRIPHDRWDFDLLPWLAAGKVRWCAPGSDNARLSADPPEQCPFADLPGLRQRMVLVADEAAARGCADGGAAWPLGSL